MLALVAQLVKNLPALRETWVRSLDWEDPLEKGKATHSSILACLENSIDYTVHGVTKSWAWLSDFHFQTQRVTERATTPNPPCFFGLVSEYTVCADALDNRCIVLPEVQRYKNDVRHI